MAAAPWLSRPWRRVACATLLLIGVARLITGGLLPMQVVLARAAGVTVGAGPLVVFGVPDRRMGPAGVAAALRASVVSRVNRVNEPLVSAKGSRPFAAVAVFAGGLSRWAVDITIIDDAMTRRVDSAPVPGFTAVARVIAEAGAAPATIIAGYVLLPALIVLRRFRYLDQNLAGQIPAIIGYVSRAALRQDLAERSGGPATAELARHLQVAGHVAPGIMMPRIRAANICVIENLDDARVTGGYADWQGHVIVCGLRFVGLRIAAPWFVGAAFGLDVLSTFYADDKPLLVARLTVSPGGGLNGLAMSELSARTRVLAIRRAADEQLLEHPPRRGTRFRAGDQAFLIGSYEELLAVLRQDRPAPRSSSPAPGVIRFPAIPSGPLRPSPASPPAAGRRTS